VRRLALFAAGVALGFGLGWHLRWLDMRARATTYWHSAQGQRFMGRIMAALDATASEGE
jgi:hypothetical protein